MRILAAVDVGASDHAWLVDRASRVASMVQGTLDLLHVTAHPEDDDAVGVLRQLVALLQRIPEASRGEPRVVGGELVDVLVEQSGYYDLLIVGPREPGAVASALFGTIATRVMRASLCPVLTVRSESWGSRAPRLLCGIDLAQGDPSWVAHEADKWALRVGGKVDLVHAMPDSNEGTRQQARAQMLRLMEAIGAPSRGQAMLGRGTPADCLNALSRRYDLLIVGNREQGIAAVLGSVPHKVVRKSACDVLTLPSMAQD